MTTEDDELSRLLDHSSVPTSEAALHSVVGRMRRRRERRLKAATAAAALVALAGVAFGIDGQLSNAPSTAAVVTRGLEAPVAAPVNGGSGDIVVPGPSSVSPATTTAPDPSPALCASDGCTIGGAAILDRLFDRTTGDVTVRAFFQHLPRVEPMSPASSSGTTGSAVSSAPSTTEMTTPANNSDGTISPSVAACLPTADLLVEVSDPGAVGEFTVSSFDGSSGASAPFSATGRNVVGVNESAPVTVVVAKADDATSIEATFADGGTDEMATKDGWAVLIEDGSDLGPVTLTALDPSGSTVGRMTVLAAGTENMPAPCGTARPVVPVPTTGHAQAGAS